MSERLDTAHAHWDTWWGDVRGRARWNEPEPDVLGFIPVLHERGATRVLDVGAGIGRHSLALAAAGFAVVAVDASTTGLGQLAATAGDRGRRVAVRLARFTALPVPDASVDHVVAWNVLYHGDGDVVRAALAECRRVLRAGGSLQVTMLSKRHRAFGVGREIRPDTYVDDASRDDKEHPHFYVDARGLTACLHDAGFVPVSMVDVDQHPPGGFHWQVLAEAGPR